MICRRRSGGREVSVAASFSPSEGSRPFYVDEKPLVRKSAQHLAKRRHQANTLAAEWECPAAVGCIAIADVKSFQACHRLLARDAVPVGAAIQRPVVEYGKFPIRGRVNVELDDVGAGIETGLYRWDRVFEIGVCRRQHPRGCAGIVGQAVLVEALRNATMGKEGRSSIMMLCEQAAVVE